MSSCAITVVAMKMYVSSTADRDPVFVGLAADIFALGQRKGERLLAVDVFARLCRGNRHRLMQVRRGDYIDSVDISVSEHFVVRRVVLADIELSA